MRALILAGGEGLRLRPVSGDLPKCLAEVGGRPFIEHQIELFKGEGITEFVLCVGIGAGLVKEALGDGRKLGVSIEYSLEETPLGTAGAIKNASPLIDGRFLCANGDTLVEFSLSEMEAAHATARAVTTILFKETIATGRGTIKLGSNNEIKGFAEKASRDALGLINCGYYIMERDVLSRIPPGKRVSLETETLPELISSGARVAGFPARGDFVDIGTPEDYGRIKEKGWRR